MHRGVSGAPPAGATSLLADRTAPGQLGRVLGEDTWDLVVDTWDGAPRVATEAAQVLRGRVSRYGYVSSMSVYAWGSHVDESSPLVPGDPVTGAGDYPALKRGAELGVLETHPDALLARAGLILGPHEDIGRLPWWLHRISRGGRVLAPGRPDRPLQYVDARDLASWLLSALSTGLAGPVDVASRSGHATTQQLLTACVQATGSGAELVWVSEADLQAHGAEPFTQIPCWVPEAGEFAGFLELDTSRAAHSGLVCRPVTDTVTDTWQWIKRRACRPNDPTATSTDCPPRWSNRSWRRSRRAANCIPHGG